ncbi:MAG: dockerin type I domain-containing protein, partial [Oscillospiraceae bacterium]|nr:dockerin type I domain-containing protein [Oscillospiraceae bacterium]
FNFKNWTSGEPNNTAGIETYAEFDATNGTWNDLRGFACVSLNIGFICEYEPITGDVNGDENVDVLDAAMIQKYTVSRANLSDEQLTVADVNNDNHVDVLDAADIQKFAAGIISEFKKKV